MRRTLIAVLALSLAGCDPAPFVCRGDGNGELPPASEVCAHLVEIGCYVDQDPHTAGFDDPSCEAGYEDVRAQVPPEELVRIARCYLAAESCAEVEGCNRRCGPDGGAISFDAGDGIRTDAGPRQDASIDASLPDAGADASTPPDASTPDAGSPDAGSKSDAGSPDAGSEPDAGIDAGPTTDGGRAPDAGG